jgi:Holliday junction DNA helicase RuvA
MVLELRDKLAPEGVALSAVMPAMSAVEEDVLSALMNLGYQRPAAERALASVEKNGKDSSFEVVFRQTLAVLSK